MSAHETHLRRALQLAVLGLYTTDPNPRVGCVIADAEGVVGEGWHVRAGEPHAEVLALLAAGTRARGADAYVTLEPCNHTGRTPPCADALIAAGIARVWCCTTDPNPKVANGGIERLRAAGIEVSVGILGREARALNPGFFSRFERLRPFIRLKMAMSLDARTSAAQGGQIWISGEASRADVQTWRARSSAILTGSGTVRCDDPQLNVRLNYGAWVRQPLRVVLDTELRLSRDSKVFSGDGSVRFAAIDAPGDNELNVERVPRAVGGLDLDAVVTRLAALEINELMLECGAGLAGGFLAKGLVDEIVLYVAPSLIGEDAAPLARLHTTGAASHLQQNFAFSDVRTIGDDVRLVLTSRKH